MMCLLVQMLRETCPLGLLHGLCLCLPPKHQVKVLPLSHWRFHVSVLAHLRQTHKQELQPAPNPTEVHALANVSGGVGSSGCCCWPCSYRRCRRTASPPCVSVGGFWGWSSCCSCRGSEDMQTPSLCVFCGAVWGGSECLLRTGSRRSGGASRWWCVSHSLLPPLGSGLPITAPGMCPVPPVEDAPLVLSSDTLALSPHPHWHFSDTY